MLTDRALRQLKPRSKLYRVADSDGLCIEVTPQGAKLWRYRYRVGGVEKMISLRASYPETSLADARVLRDAQRRILRSGVDPSFQRRRDKAIGAIARANTFEAVAREWLLTKSPEWVEDHTQKVRNWLEQHVFPILGTQPISDIEAPDILAMLRKLTTRGTLNTAGRVRQTVSAIFRYAIATGRAQRDPAADLRDALPSPTKKNFASITEPKAVGELLRAIDGYQGSPIVLAALKLSPLVFVRPGELRGAEWSEFDLDAAEWRIPASRRKLRKAAKANPRTPPHVVPLSTQAVDVLRELHALTGSRRFVFPGVREGRRPMSENTVNAALRRLGYAKEQMTGHGFRHLASTLLNELGWRPDAIEEQLAHSDPNKIRGTYNKAKYLEERRRLMQAWADHLDGLRAGAEVVPIRRIA